MKSYLCAVLALAACVAVALLAREGVPVSSGAAQNPSPPEMHLWAARGANLDCTGTQYACGVRARTASKSLTIRWENLFIGKAYEEGIQMTIYPTAVCASGSPLEMFVAGVDGLGDVVIERLVLQPPTYLTITPVGGGPPAYEFFSSGLAVQEEEYRESDSIIGTISGMCSMLSGDLIFIEVYATSAYQFDHESPGAVPVLIASKIATGIGIQTIPGFESWHRTVESADHNTWGNVFFVGSATEQGLLIVLHDMDRDGVVDGYVTVESSAEWVGYNFHDASQYSFWPGN